MRPPGSCDDGRTGAHSSRGVLAGWLTFRLIRADLFPWTTAFELFGLVGGAALARGREGDRARGEVRACVAAMAIGWSASISLGYNTPVLGAGLMTASLFHLIAWPRSNRFRWAERSSWLHPICALAALVVFVRIRREYIYHDRPASELTSPLEGRLPGGALLYTNALTAAFIDDVNAAVAAAHGRTYALIPNFAGWWAKAEQLNPLPVDWLYWQELPRPELTARVIDALSAQRGRIIVIAEKTNTDAYAREPFGMPDIIYSPALPYVRQNWRKVGETRSSISSNDSSPPHPSPSSPVSPSLR